MTIGIVDHELPDDTHNLYDVTFYDLSVRTLLTSSPPMAASWLSSRGSQDLLVGLDVEWRPNFTRDSDNPVAILQLSVGLHCLIFQLLHAPEVPQTLADFLRDPRHVFVGVGIDEDVEKLLCDYGLNVANTVDLRALAARELGREELRRAGLKTLAKEVLGREIEKPKRVSKSRWDNPWLTSVQVQYACLDAFVSLQIGEALNAGGARPTAHPDEGSSVAESSNPTNGAAQDRNNQRLTNLLLNGVNYFPWSRAVTIALGERSRLGHVTGRTEAPATTDPNFDEWQANDYDVMSWILSSMEPQMCDISYLDTAKNLWDSLYEMYGQDRNNQRLTNLLLNGVNYLPWSRAVTIALGERSRLGHVTGRTKAPAMTDPNFDEWQANDYDVMSWIVCSMEPQMCDISYLATAKDLWDSLYAMYGQASNASQVFKLQQGLVCSKQGMNQSFTEHLSKMKKLWEDLRQYRPITPNVRDYIQREEQDRIFQLLASLKPEFEETKRDILMRPKLPSFNTVCSIIQNEETRKRVMAANSKVKAFVDSPENLAHYTMSNFKQSDASSRWAKEKGKKPIRFYCDHCNRDGHSRERCWVLNPQLRPGKDKGLDAKFAVRGDVTEF